MYIWNVCIITFRSRNCLLRIALLSFLRFVRGGGDVESHSKHPKTHTVHGRVISAACRIVLYIHFVGSRVFREHETETKNVGQTYICLQLCEESNAYGDCSIYQRSVCDREIDVSMRLMWTLYDYPRAYAIISIWIDRSADRAAAALCQCVCIFNVHKWCSLCLCVCVFSFPSVMQTCT